MVFQSLAGIVVLTGLAWLFSEKKRIFPWRSVLAGLGLQMVLVVVMLYTPGASQVFQVLNKAVEYLQEATNAGTGFVFGYLGGGKLPFEAADPGSTFVFAFMACPWCWWFPPYPPCSTTGAFCRKSCGLLPGFSTKP